MLHVVPGRGAHEAGPNAGYPAGAGSAGDDRSLGCTGRARGPLSGADASALGASPLAEVALGSGSRVGCLHAPPRVPGCASFCDHFVAALARGAGLVVAGLLLLLAQALKAFGWARLFTNRERTSPLALVAGNGGAALVGVVLPVASTMRCGSRSCVATQVVPLVCGQSASRWSCSV
jgi:hypothetical protein